MKKLMTLLSAATVAIGLYATDTGTSFEGATPGDFDITEADDLLGGGGSGYWETNANSTVELKVKEGSSIGRTEKAPTGEDAFPQQFADSADEQYLHIASTFGSPLKRYVTNSDPRGSVSFATDPYYFDSLVKFTAFEDDPLTTAVTNELNGAKIAVWIQTNADETQTNLYVRAGKFVNGDVVAQTYDCGAFRDTENYNGWHRLTIKAIGNIYTGADPVPGFAVFIDNQAHISGVLRYRMPIEHVIKLVSSLQLQSESINTWKNGVERALKKYLGDGAEAVENEDNAE